MEFNTRILFLSFAILMLVMFLSIEAKPSSKLRKIFIRSEYPNFSPLSDADPKVLEELMEIEDSQQQPLYRYANINRAYENEATKRQLKAFADNGVPRNAMDMMRALIALRRYRR